MKHTLRLAAAAFAAAALALLGAGVPTANADPNPGIINPDATVTLNVHKYLGPATTVEGNGKTPPASLTGYTAVKGVDFDVYRVYYDSGPTNPVDLTTNAGWEAAAAITGYMPTQMDFTNGYFDVDPDGAGPLPSVRYYLSTSPVTQATDNTGLASFSPLGGVGLYLVNENLGSSGPVQSCTIEATPVCTDITKSQVSPAAPFFVTLPMTDPDNLSTWMYTVNVYPKNQADQVTKTVTDKNTQTAEGTGRGGDHTITFTITSGITDGMSAATMGEYVITDTLDSRLSSPSVNVYIDANHNGTYDSGTDVQLSAPTDYTLSGNVVISMTATGLGKMVTANGVDAAATVVTEITATVTEEGTTGLITNQAYVIPNQAWDNANTTPGIPTNATPDYPGGIATKTYYGDLNITKVDPKTAGANMSGAQFAVYIDTVAPSSTCSAADVDSTKTVIATGTTDSGGLLTIKGLQTSDWYDGGPQTDHIYYCLVETVAPTGYNLNAQPISFQILKSGDTTPAYFDLTVNNQKKNLGNDLPFTGGQGVAVMSIGGALLVGAGLVYYLVYSRRHRNAQ